jgi:hypothetical protein
MHVIHPDDFARRLYHRLRWLANCCLTARDRKPQSCELGNSVRGFARCSVPVAALNRGEEPGAIVSATGVV